MALPELRQLVAIFPPQQPGFRPRSGHIGFVVDKAALGQVFSKYSSRSGTIGQIVANVPSGLSLTPPQEKKKNVSRLEAVRLPKDHVCLHNEVTIMQLVDCSVGNTDGSDL
jgi:hypothetical protein